MLLAIYGVSTALSCLYVAGYLRRVYSFVLSVLTTFLRTHCPINHAEWRMTLLRFYWMSIHRSFTLYAGYIIAHESAFANKHNISWDIIQYR